MVKKKIALWVCFISLLNKVLLIGGPIYSSSYTLLGLAQCLVYKQKLGFRNENCCISKCHSLTYEILPALVSLALELYLPPLPHVYPVLQLLTALAVPRVLCIFTCCFFCPKYVSSFCALKNPIHLSSFNLNVSSSVKASFILSKPRRSDYTLLCSISALIQTSMIGLITLSYNCLFSHPSLACSPLLSPVTDPRGQGP